MLERSGKSAGPVSESGTEGRVPSGSPEKNTRRLHLCLRKLREKLQAGSLNNTSCFCGLNKRANPIVKKQFPQVVH